MRRTTLLGGIAGVAAASPFAGIGFAQSLQTVRVGLAEGDDATPTLYAVKSGLFKKYGIDVQVTAVASGAAGLAALAGGAIDVTSTSLLPFLSARSKGLPLTIVAPLAAYSPDSVYAVILVKKDAPYKTGRDLNGKTVASPALRDSTMYTNTHHDQTLPIYAAFAKIDPKDIEGAPRAESAPYVDAKDIQPIINVAVKYGVIAQAMNPQDLISPSALKPGS
jgi:ABC-type nitrate/sulfonate/bicarbonate transport system substrate-binding protein